MNFIVYNTGINRRGIHFHQEELEALSFLAQIGYLSADQWHRYVTSLGEYSPTLDSFRNRIKNKYVSNNIVRKFHYSYGQAGFGHAYYLISLSGWKLLQELNYIDPSLAYPETFKKPVTSTQITHTLSIREMLLRILLLDRKLYHSDTEQISFLTASPEDVIPDWILKKGSVQLNIEMDTGKESHQLIANKLIRYGHLARNNPKETFVVLLSIVDDSFKTREPYGDRFIRVLNLKESICSLEFLYDVKNLHILVSPGKQSDRLGVQHLNKEVRFSKQERVSAIEQMMSMALKRTDFVAERTGSLFLNEQETYDVSYKIYMDNQTLYIHCLFLQDALITDYHRLKQSYKQFLNQSEHNSDILMVLYPMNESLHGDVILQRGVTFERTIFTDFDLLISESTPSCIGSDNEVVSLYEYVAKLLQSGIKQ